MGKQNHYAGLDLLRIAAAGLVLFNHYGQFNATYHAAAHGDVIGDPLAFPFMGPFSGIGSVGVEIFFVISGFVITGSVHKATPLQFLTRRIVRVFPALWICATIALIARASTGESLPYVVACWGRSAILSPIGPYIDGVVWTLIVEAFFYGCVFFSLLLVKTRPLETLAFVIGYASVAFLVVFAAVRLDMAHPGAATLYALLDRFPFKVILLRHGVFFALGMLLWRWIESGRPRAGIAHMLLFASFGVVEIAASSFNPAPAPTVTVAIWLVGMAWLYCAIRFNDWIAGVIAPSRRFVDQLGRLSYTIYLGHYAFGMVVASSLHALGLDEILTFSLTTVVITATAWIVMIGPERYLQGALKARLATLGALYQRKRQMGEIL